MKDAIEFGEAMSILPPSTTEEAAAVRWECQSDLGWVVYDAKSSAELEEAFASASSASSSSVVRIAVKTPLLVHRGGEQYDVDVVKLTQRNVKTNYVRKIRRLGADDGGNAGVKIRDAPDRGIGDPALPELSAASVVLERAWALEGRSSEAPPARSSPCSARAGCRGPPSPPPAQ